jgi:lipopolysaccharide/colanic/teichoic acid biosynthesis glycosyltransferase
LVSHGPAPRTLPRTDRKSTARHLASAGAVPGWKRILDILCILISLPVTLPSMAAVAIWIKLVSRGPVLFRQERIGRNGRRFTLYKFRSMKVNAPTQRHERHFRQLVESDCPMVKLDLLSDKRVISGGCFLRAAGLDELPQLINVLRGEMSLVGPRPCLPEEYCFFSTRQRERFEVLPGLTGIWQVVGKGVATFSEMNAMDLLYVRRSSLGLDLSVIFRTPLALLRQMSQAYKENHKPAVKDQYTSPVEPSLSGYSTQRLS